MGGANREIEVDCVLREDGDQGQDDKGKAG
jgi:hypothetical protein